LDILKRFISRRADSFGTGTKPVKLISSSLDQKKIDELKEKLTEKYRVIVTSRIETSQCLPSLSDYFSFDINKHTMVFFRASGQTEKLIIPVPDIMEGSNGGQYWMNDFYMESNVKRVVAINLQTWWHLPSKNVLSRCFIPNKPSRITKDGLVSCLLQRSNQFFPEGQEVEIRLPSDKEILETLVTGIDEPYYTSDIRHKEKREYIFNTEISNNGQFLYGFLNVFGGLGNADAILSEKCWRDLFDLMNKTKNNDESRKLKELSNVLKKKINSIKIDSDFPKESFIDWLANKTINLAKIYEDQGVTSVNFEDLKKINQNACDVHNQKYPENILVNNEEDLLSSLHDLMILGVIYAGFEVNCPVCSYKEWRSLGDVKQNIVCRGCGNKYKLYPESEMRYKANLLVSKGIKNYGLVPLTLALGSLYEKSHDFFMYMPPLDLYKRGKHLTDLDIVSIVDGKFVIGEIKENCSLFTTDIFDSMSDIAIDLNVDKLVFSCLSKNPTQFIVKNIERIKKKMEPYKIEVEWLYLGYSVFDESPLF